MLSKWNYKVLSGHILNILLIEDNRVIAQQVTEFLSAHNWQIDYADNAKLGIQLASENIFDVILLDLNLPDMDGLEVCARTYCNWGMHSGFWTSGASKVVLNGAAAEEQQTPPEALPGRHALTKMLQNW